MPLVPVQIGQDIMAIDNNDMEFMFLAPPSLRSFWIHHWYSIVLTKEKTGFKQCGKSQVWSLKFKGKLVSSG